MILQDISEILPFIWGTTYRTIFTCACLFFNQFGQLIKGSGLMEILNLEKLLTIGLSVVADVNSIQRAIYCIQVSLSTLYIKLNKATS